MSRRFKRNKTSKSIYKNLSNPLVIELVVPFLGIVDVGRVATVNTHFYSHVRGRLLYEQKNSNFPQANPYPIDHIEVILRLDVVKVPPAFVSTLAKDGKKCEIINDPRETNEFDSMGYLEKATAITEYGEKFKMFYESIPKPALAFFARKHFHDVLSKSQAVLAQSGSRVLDRPHDVGDGTCDKHVELVIDCVKGRYYSLEDSRLADRWALNLEMPLP